MAQKKNIELLKVRKQKLENNGKENYNIIKKIERQIRKDA